jgi:hypothetical protein
MIIKLTKILTLNIEYTHKNKLNNCAVKKQEWEAYKNSQKPQKRFLRNNISFKNMVSCRDIRIAPALL